MANQKERIVIEAVDNTTRGMRSAQNKLNAFDRTIKRVQTTLLGFVGINIGLGLAKGLITASDAAVELEAKLRLMTDGTEDFNAAQAELVKISKESGSSLNSNIILFTRMNRAIQASGGTMETTLGVTRALSQGLRISGASAQESASVVRQFSQAMASGVLRGEEFNAIMENGGRIGLALARGLQVPIGALREMAKAGELTAQRVTDALLSQSQALAEENAKLPLTIGRAFENVRTEWTLLLSSFKTGNSGIATVIDSIAQNFTEIAKAIKIAVQAAALFWGAKSLKAIVEYGVQLRNQVQNWIALQAQQQLAIRQEKIRAGLAATHAARQEQFHAKRIAALHAERIAETAKNLQLAQAELIEIRTATRRAKNLVTYNAGVLAKAKAISTEIAAEQRLLATQIKGEQNAVIRNRLAAQAQALAIHHAETLAVVDVASKKLLTTETALTAAYAAQRTAIIGTTAALTASTAAKTASTVATASGGVVLTQATSKTSAFIGALRRIPKAGKAVLLFFRSLGSALLGLPGLLLFIGGSILGQFYDLRVLFEVLVSQLEKFITILANPLDYIFGGGDLDNKLDAIDQKFNDFYLNRERNRAAEEAGHEDHNAKLLADLEKTQTQLIQIESDRVNAVKALDELRGDSFKQMLDEIEAESERRGNDNENRIAKIEFETELEKEALRARLTNKEEYEAAVEALEIESITKIQDATLEFIESEKQQYNDFYKAQIVGAKGNQKRQLELAVELGDKLKDLNREAVESLRENLTEMQAQYANFGEAIKSIDDQIKQDKEDHETFLREIEGDLRADWQKSLDAQKDRYDAEALLTKANSLDKETEADQILALNQEARDDLKETIKSETERAENAKEGSLEQLQAQANVNAALASYKKAVQGVLDAQTTLKEQAKDSQEILKQSIADRAESLEKYQKAIDAIDEQVSHQRELSIHINSDEIISEIDRIEAKIDELDGKVITLKIQEQRVSEQIEQKQSGGTVGKYASGGYIPRANRVPGSGSGDKVKALLEPGEFIMRKSAVQKFGEGAMYALNRGEDVIRRKAGGMVQRFATGGKVEDDPFAAFLKNRTSVKEFAQAKTTKLSEASQQKREAILEEFKNRDTSGALVDKYSGLLKEQQGVIAKGGHGMAAYIKIFRAQTAVKYIENMLKSAGNLKGKSPKLVADVAQVNNSILTLIRALSRGGKSRSILPQISALIAKRNAIAGGGDAAPTFTAGSHTTFLDRLAEKKKTKLLKDQQAQDGSDDSSAKTLKEKLDEKLQELKLGGVVRRFADGGSVPGTGLGDTVKALLTPGEFVMKKGVVASFGQDFFNNLNNGIMPQRFAQGGVVGSDDNNVETINVNFNIDGRQATGSFPKSDATTALLEQLKQSGAAS